jgi:hypothetical protein
MIYAARVPDGDERSRGGLLLSFRERRSFGTVTQGSAKNASPWAIIFVTFGDKEF